MIEKITWDFWIWAFSINAGLLFLLIWQDQVMDVYLSYRQQMILMSVLTLIVAATGAISLVTWP